MHTTFFRRLFAPKTQAALRAPRRRRLVLERLEERSLLSAASDNYLAALYPDALNRPLDPTGQAFWGAALDQGLPASQVALAVLSSDEATTQQVHDVYRELLDRPADPAGLAAGVSFLQGGGSPQALRAILLGSDEFLARLPEPTNARFLDALYNEVLGRPADPASQGLLAVLNAGLSRVAAATLVLQSPEALSRLVQTHYVDLLGRSGSPEELAALVTVLQTGVPEVVLRASFLGAQEYLARVQGTRPPADTTAPDAPTNLRLTSDTDTGVVGDNRTANRRAALQGTAEPGALVRILNAGTLVGQANASPNGTFAIDLGTLSRNVASFTANAQDAAGNTSPATSVTITVDLLGPQFVALSGRPGERSVQVLLSEAVTETLLAEATPECGRGVT